MITSGGGNNNYSNNNTLRNRLLMLLKTFGPFLVHSIRTCIYWIINIIRAKLSNAHFNSNPPDVFLSFFVSQCIHTPKKNWLFVKDFARRMKLNWQYNGKKMLRILFFTLHSQFMSISNRNIWFSFQRVRFSRFVTKKWEKNKFVFQNFIFVFDVIVHLYLSYFVRSFVRFARFPSSSSFVSLHWY